MAYIMTQTKVTLKTLNNTGSLRTEGALTCTYELSHNDMKVIMDQGLKLERTNGQWTAEPIITDFPNMPTSHDAAQKLADWMEKMAVTIRAHDFSKINFDEL